MIYAPFLYVDGFCSFRYLYSLTFYSWVNISCCIVERKLWSPLKSSIRRAQNRLSSLPMTQFQKTYRATSLAWLGLSTCMILAYIWYVRFSQLSIVSCNVCVQGNKNRHVFGASKAATMYEHYAIQLYVLLVLLNCYSFGVNWELRARELSWTPNPSYLLDDGRRWSSLERLCDGLAK